MNCQQADKLLALYAGDDLDTRRAGLVSAHLQSCFTCRSIAEEYREATQLTRKFTPPVFSEDVYAGIRQRVLHEIEQETGNPTISEALANLFRPRLRWAFAAAVLAVAILSVYFIANRGNDRRQLTDGDSTTYPAKDKLVKGQNESGTAPSGPTPSATAVPKHQSIVGKPERRNYRDPVNGRAGSVAVNAPNRQSVTTEASPKDDNLVQPNVLPAGDSSASEKGLRMEIQTKDPNIRIIWFSPQHTQPVTPSSKGI